MAKAPFDPGDVVVCIKDDRNIYGSYNVDIDGFCAINEVYVIDACELVYDRYQNARWGVQLLGIPTGTWWFAAERFRKLEDKKSVVEKEVAELV